MTIVAVLPRAAMERDGFAAIGVGHYVGRHFRLAAVRAVDLGIPGCIQQLLIGPVVVTQGRIVTLRLCSLQRRHTFENDNPAVV